MNVEHPAFATTLNHYLSLLTIIGAGIAVLFLLKIIYLLYTKKSYAYLKTIDAYIFLLGFILSLGGTLLTIYYQYWLLYAPCDLCWYQRIFLYPLVFLFGYAWMKKDRAIFPYVLVLSAIGFAIALYHHFLQVGYDLLKPCSTAPFAVDCAKPSFVEYGFVTFPFMATVLFAFIFLFTITAMRYGKR